MGGLSDIGCVVVIMVRDVLAVMILQIHEERYKRFGRDLERLHQITFLQEANSRVGQTLVRRKRAENDAAYFEYCVSDGCQRSVTG